MGYNILMPKGIYDHKPENYPPSRKGSKLTEEHKQRIREFMTGNTPGNKGKKMSAESSRMKSVNNARYWLGKKRPNQFRNKGKFGKKHPRWVEDKNIPLYKAIRNHFKYHKWRLEIFKRDNFTCVLCGKKSPRIIHADHYPIRFIDIVRGNNINTLDEADACKDFWDTKNGRTLCVPCHKKTDTWGGRTKTILQHE